MNDESELTELILELLRLGKAETFPQAYFRARQERRDLRNFAAEWNQDASVGLLCHRATIWRTAPKANAA